MTDAKKANGLLSVLTYDDVRAVSPALEHYTKEPLLDGLWNRPEMSPRDRSIVTVAALIARIQTIEMPFHFAVALDNGVKPVELSEIITHLAFLLRMGKCDVRGCRGKGHLSTARNWNRSTSTAKDKLMPLNEEAEVQRATPDGRLPRLRPYALASPDGRRVHVPESGECRSGHGRGGRLSLHKIPAVAEN